MLDFYLILDIQATPAYPEALQLELVGSLELTIFNRLQNKGIIAPKFDFYQDFRWNAEQVNVILAKLNNSKDTDCKTLQNILRSAAEKSTGLIAYSD